MSYKLFGGVHDILSSVDELKLLGPNQREKGQIIAVKDGDYRVYIWDPTATAKGLLCSLSNEDPVSTMWPSKASTWYPQTTPSVFEERAHMIEEDGVRTDYSGNILRDDFSYLFVVPDDISGGVASSTDYTNIEGRWVAMNYASLVDGIPWDTRSGHILPRYNDTFDFGNAEHKVRDFYLSSSTIWMGEDHKISIDGSGQLKFLKRKKGKLPEYIMANAITSHGSEAAATRVLLQAIKDSTEITSPHVNAIDNITDSTVVPPGMNLSLRDWIRLAIATGFNNPIPDGIFGESDFEDAISLHSHSDSDGDDGSTGGPYADLGDLLGRLDILEDYFNGGFLDKAFVDPQILRDEALDSYLAAKFAEHINGETDIVRDGDFGDLWNDRWFDLPEWLRADELIINWPDIVNPPDFVLGTDFDTRWDTRLGTIGPGDILGLDDYISANPDVLLGAGARGFFDDAGILKQEHGDWIASIDYADGLGPVIIPAGSVDLTQYARVADLNEVLLNKLNISDVDSYIPDMTAANEVIGYFNDGMLDASRISGLLDASNVPDVPYGSIIGLGDLLNEKLNVADLPPFDQYIDTSVMESYVADAIAGLDLGALATKEDLGIGDILNLDIRLGELQTGLEGKLDVGSLPTTFPIDAITGLQDILDGKLTHDGNFGVGDITNLQSLLDGKLGIEDSIPAGNISGFLDLSNIPLAVARTADIPTAIDTGNFATLDSIANLATHADLLQVEAGLTNLYDKSLIQGDSNLTYNKLGGGSETTYGYFGATMTGFINGKMDDRGLTSTGLTNLINANANVQKGVTAESYFTAGGVLDSSTRVPNLAASKITSGAFATGRIPSLDASKIGSGVINNSRISSSIARDSELTGFATTAQLGSYATTTALNNVAADVATNATNIGNNTSNLLTTDTALFNLYNKAVTTGTSALSYNSPLNNSGASTSDKFTDQSVAATKLTGTISTARIPNLNASKITAGSFNTARIPNLNASKITAGSFSTARIPTLAQSKVSGLTTALTNLQTNFLALAPTGYVFLDLPSDKDLKNIIRVVPADEITTDYYLIGLTTVEYEWNQIATDLFGLSGHTAEGFIAEQLEQLYPAPDPENPPTSKEDGHIWWHEHMSDEQKALTDNVHNYYTFFNSEMLQEKINAAKAALASD